MRLCDCSLVLIISCHEFDFEYESRDCLHFASNDEVAGLV